jgi:hypothetical protein
VASSLFDASQPLMDCAINYEYGKKSIFSMEGPMVAINDNIWLSQIYIPWSINQFGLTGVPADPNNFVDSDGILITSTPMNGWALMTTALSNILIRIQ